MRTLLDMRSDQLSSDQLEALHERLSEMLGYLNRLEHRFDKRGFPADDWLRMTVSEARLKVQAVVKALTDLGAGSVFGSSAEAWDPLGRKPRKHWPRPK